VKLCLRDSLARLYSHPQHKRVVKNTHADVTSTIIRRDDHTISSSSRTNSRQRSLYSVVLLLSNK